MGRWLKVCQDHPACLVRGIDGVESHVPGPLRFDDLHTALYAAQSHVEEEKQRAIQLIAEAEATREGAAAAVKAAKQSVGELETIRQECERRLDDVRRSIRGETERLKGEIELVRKRHS